MLWVKVVVNGIGGVSGTEFLPAIFTRFAVFEFVACIVAFSTMEPFGVLEWKSAWCRWCCWTRWWRRWVWVRMRVILCMGLCVGLRTWMKLLLRTRSSRTSCCWARSGSCLWNSTWFHCFFVWWWCLFFSCVTPICIWIWWRPHCFMWMKNTTEFFPIKYRCNNRFVLLIPFDCKERVEIFCHWKIVK